MVHTGGRLGTSRYSLSEENISVTLGTTGIHIAPSICVRFKSEIIFIFIFNTDCQPLFFRKPRHKLCDLKLKMYTNVVTFRYTYIYICIHISQTTT